MTWLKRLSIITPVYNREDVIGRCIESFLRQGCVQVEMIIIDDGSTDSTIDIISSYSKKYEGIAVITYPENRGVNYARNIGIAKAKGEFCLFLDSDDRLYENALERVCKIIEKHVGINHYLFEVSGLQYNYNSIRDRSRSNYYDWLSGAISGDYTHVVLTKILRQFPFYEHVKAYEETNWYRIFKRTEAQLIHREVLVEVERRREDSLSNTYKLISRDRIKNQFVAYRILMTNYGIDMKKYNPKRYKLILGRILLYQYLFKEEDIGAAMSTEKCDLLISRIIRIIPSRMWIKIITLKARYF